jgi:3-dehydroquinate dehydratase/shikimate dehydrogenase
MTHLCVAIFVTSVDQAKRDMATALEAGADMVELRVDLLRDPADLHRLWSDAMLPCVVTCRPTWEGGQSELTDGERLDLLNHVLTPGPNGLVNDYVDIELVTARRNALYRHPERMIVSSHDFTGRPTLLNKTLQQLYESPAAIAKLVWTARTVRDNLEAFEILQQRQKPTIALCMGEAGLISRVLAKKFGGFLTFASLEEGAGTAPGQVSIHDMKRLYRWDAINPRTSVYGVVASPVAHSMSPAVHNAAFDDAAFDGVYLPLLVNPGYESFKAFMESFVPFDGLDLSGLSVTLPHKENALRYLKEKGAEVEPLAERIGAVNTIVIDRPAHHASRTTHHSLRGLNTDYAAILDSITAALGVTREALAGYRVAVIGAGGTGRTAVAALAHCGATVVVYNRTRDRADALAAEFNGRSGKVVAAAMDKLCDSCCQVYLNTTSIGMHPDVDASPFGDGPPKLGPDTLVFDAVYNPPVTKLLRQAGDAGAKTIGGIEMFVRQAAAQFEAWTGLPAPAETMRRIVERRLAR